MFKSIFGFEIRYRSRRPIVYVYFIFFFLLSFICFSRGIVSVGDGIHINAPFVLTKFFVTMSFLLLIVTAAIMGQAIYRDIEYATYPYFFSLPITKPGYFWGRFAASFLVILFISSALVWGSMAGTFIGSLLKWLPDKNVGPFILVSYLQPYFFYLVINLFFTSCIFFGVVSLARNIKVIYSSIILIYIASLICGAITKNVANQNLSYYLDAFAFNPLSILERTLTYKEKGCISNFRMLSGGSKI